MRIFILSFLALFIIEKSAAQDLSRFKQMEEEWPTPNSYRNAAGAPGVSYWQQRADYVIQVELDDKKQKIKGKETITYHNNSPESLTYLWIQLDQNIFSKESDANIIKTGKMDDNMSLNSLKNLAPHDFDLGFKITSVKTTAGSALPYIINKTMMRVDLPKPLLPKTSFSFNIEWNNNINDAKAVGGRCGMEFFSKDSNFIYEMAQWFPRMAVYDDVNGWQHKQFLGRGEFALPFGNYRVSITVPADHVVASTGTLQNPQQVLSAAQAQRLREAKSQFTKPVLIITPEEALKNEKSHAHGTKTWIFQADNVRDFAWASSRKFIWDAMNTKVGGKEIMSMSFYPKEANPLWEQYSTQAVAHTLKVYSKFTIDYPYPVAISVNGPVGGMEYPMISFNGARPEADGTYSERTKYALISVIIHEVGHNFFPMIINSDERQWSWMDEGLNTFVQYLAEQEWDRNYPSRRGPARYIVDYMKSDKSVLEPIMTNSESINQFGNNAYGKPATGLNILRETVMGRELFDYAFKEYCRRWAFRHPSPSDFFRTMEDASAVDLDWFWRGWFYTTDNVDIALENVTHYSLNTMNPEIEYPRLRAEKAGAPKDISSERNKTDIKTTLVEENPAVLDFYNKFDPLEVTASAKAKFNNFYNNLDEKQKEVLNSGANYYQLDFKNLGGLFMPIILELEYEDGTREIQRYPVEIWIKNENAFSKIIVTKKRVVNFVLDPFLETADVDTSNNHFPRKVQPTRYQMFKNKQAEEKNPMQQQRQERN